MLVRNLPPKNLSALCRPLLVPSLSLRHHLPHTTFLSLRSPTNDNGKVDNGNRRNSERFRGGEIMIGLSRGSGTLLRPQMMGRNERPAELRMLDPILIFPSPFRVLVPPLAFRAHTFPPQPTFGLDHSLLVLRRSLPDTTSPVPTPGTLPWHTHIRWVPMNMAT